MRMERQSKQDLQSLKYMLQNSVKTAVKEVDTQGNVEYITVDGVQIPLETGAYDVGQGEEPEQGEATKSVIVCFDGNIAFSGGESDLREYGVDSSDYDAVLIMPKGSIPVIETSYIWHDSEPKYKDGTDVVFDDDECTVDSYGHKSFGFEKAIDTASADFRVTKVVPSLGIKRYLLKKVVH